MLGTAVGGVVADAYGWRMAFFVCGLPGIALAGIALLTLVEPRAKAVMKQVRAVDLFGGKSLSEAMAIFAKKRTFWLVAFAAATKAFIGYGHAPFTASFFLRNHTQEVASLAASFGLKSVGFIGLALSLIAGTGGIVGAILGGVIADRYGSRDLRAYVSVPGIAALITIPIYIFAVTMADPVLAIFILAINAVLATLWYGPVYATAQSIVPPHLRATAAAILLLVINLIGLGLGPVAVGALSDVLATYGGLGKAEGIRWALILSTLFGVAAFIFFWLARKTIREEMES
jgi:MFS family permease